jgi:hypothetical protein
MKRAAVHAVSILSVAMHNFRQRASGMRHTPKWTVTSMVRRPGLLLPAPFGGLPVSAAIRVEAIEEVHHRVDDVGVALGQSR